MESEEPEKVVSKEEAQLAQSEAELQALEDRLVKIKGPASKGDKQFARGLALVASFGFVLAGCLVGGLMIGDYLVAESGHKIFRLVGLFLGLFTALFAGVKLMKPLMRSEN